MTVRADARARARRNERIRRSACADAAAAAAAARSPWPDSFCKKAKAVLDEMKVPYTAYELTEMGDEGKALRAELAEMTGRTSVPNTFIAGEGIGGCNDGPGLMTLKENGKLEPMLRAAGVLE